jgi:hypothetical protein
MTMQRHLAALFVVLSLVLAAPAAALAQSSPFAPLPPPSPSQQQVQTTPKNTNNLGNGGLKRWQEILIFLGGVVLLGGIALAILSDARRRAPVADGELVAATPGTGSHKHASKQRQRKKAKAARAARRRNR